MTLITDALVFPDEEIRTDRILPCPFCGGQGEVLHDKGYTDDYGYMPENWVVVCSNPDCKLVVNTTLCTKYENAIRIWNRRVAIEE